MSESVRAETGISYPLANEGGGYDSGQLGFGTPAVGKLSWSTPAGLQPGTYTFFCRIHPSCAACAGSSGSAVLAGV